MRARHREEGLPFQPSFEPLDEPHGSVPACQQGDGRIRLRREDTTGQPLPASDTGPVKGLTDEKKVSPELDDAGQVATYTGLCPGEQAWSWEENPTGAHLIALGTVSEQRHFQPGEVLGDPPLIEAIPEGREARAVHLPPPVMINLREEAGEPVTLSPEQLDYFRRNGDNALVFIHGYNVSHGDWGQFLDRVIERPVGRGQPHRQPEWHSNPSTVWQNPEKAAHPHDLELDDEKLNGTGAHNWAVAMEYQLNRAAGFDGEDWTPYSRIVAVSWPGDTGSTDFMQSEFNAMAAGRRLVALLGQLTDAGIAVNVVTHSLGARVALTALNILGQIREKPVLDHLFLWEPAVADNALTNDAERDRHPLGMGVFVNAHKATRQIVVLHSRGDGILGPTDREEMDIWERLLSVTPAYWLYNAGASLANGRLMDDALGTLGSAYTKKWWTFPAFLDNGLGAPLERLYADFLPLRTEPPEFRRGEVVSEGVSQSEVNTNWGRLEQAVISEASALFETCKSCLKSGQPIPRYHLLSPLNHLALITKARAKQYVRQLRALAESDWYPEQAPRPALGYDGIEGLIGIEAGDNRDDFIENQYDQGGLIPVDQSDCLFSHSGMRVPDEKVFKLSYKEEIMVRIRGGQSGFGTY